MLRPNKRAIFWTLAATNWTMDHFLAKKHIYTQKIIVNLHPNKEDYNENITKTNVTNGHADMGNYCRWSLLQ